jgi:hypothetical protein
MSDEIQPVVPAEVENAVEQATVAEVSAPDVEAAGEEEVLEKIQEELDKLPEDVFLSPNEVDALIEKIFFEKEQSETVKVKLKDGYPDCIIPGREGFASGVVFEMTRARLNELSGAAFIEVVEERADEAFESHEEDL